MKRMDISGFSGSYENACQTMLQRWMDATKERSFDELFPEREGKRRLDEAVEKELLRLVDDIGPSGAQWGATLSHFAYIKEKGYEAWVREGERKDRLVEWDPSDRIHFDSAEEAFEAGKRAGEVFKS
mgnify:FL=1